MQYLNFSDVPFETLRTLHGNIAKVSSSLTKTIVVGSKKEVSRETGSKPRPTYEDLTMKKRMIIAPFPAANCTEDQINEIQEKLIELLFMAGDPGLQLMSHSRECGALVVSCANKAIRAWLK